MKNGGGELEGFLVYATTDVWKQNLGFELTVCNVEFSLLHPKLRTFTLLSTIGKENWQNIGQNKNDSPFSNCVRKWRNQAKPNGPFGFVLHSQELTQLENGE